MKTKKSVALCAAVSVAALAFAVFGDGLATPTVVASTSADDVSTNGVASASGRGATQKWVNMRIKQAKEEIMSDVDAKISTLTAQLESAIESSMNILADASNTNAVREAMSEQSIAAQPLATAIFNSVMQ